MSREVLFILMILLFIASISLFFYFFHLMRTIKNKKNLEVPVDGNNAIDDGEDDVEISLTEEEIQEEKNRVVEPVIMEKSTAAKELGTNEEPGQPVYVKLNELNDIENNELDNNEVTEETEEENDNEITIDNINDDIDEDEVTVNEKVPVEPEEKINIVVNNEVKEPEKVEENNIVISINPEVKEEPKVEVEKDDEPKIVIKANKVEPPKDDFIKIDGNQIDEIRVDEVKVDVPVVSINNNLSEVVNVSIKGKNYVFLANGNKVNTNDKVHLSINNKEYEGTITRGNYQKDISKMKVKPRDLNIIK